MTVSLPVLLPFITGILLLLLRENRSLRRTIAVLSLLLQLGAAMVLAGTAFSSGMEVMHLGSWKDPIGIVLVGDRTASILVILALLVTLTSTLAGFSERGPAQGNPMRLPLVQFLLTGIQLSFLTGDLFNLFVAFEVMLLSSYGLMTLEAEDGKLKQAYPYVLLNLLSSALFLAACGYTYALFGTLNFAGIAEAAAALESTSGGPARIALLTAILAFVFSIKAGMFPLYYWLPNSYPTLPPSLGALYSGLLTKVGIYLLLRLLGTVMPPGQEGLYLLIAWLGGATMFFGVLGPISRIGIREILAFHVLSQIGFMLFAIGIFTPFAFAAALFYMIHNIIVKSGLFLIASGVMLRFHTDNLKRIGGLWRSQPALALAFLVLALSLAGLPPLSGFWAKLWILLEGLSEGYYVLVALSLVTSILTLVSMMKIWFGAFWQPLPSGSVERPAKAGLLGTALALMVIVSLGVSVGVAPIWEACQEAASELFTPSLYIEAILHRVPEAP